MTSILSLVHGDRVFMLGDGRAAGDDGHVQARKNTKVFVRDFGGEDRRMAIGYAGSVRMGQLVQFELEVPEIPRHPSRDPQEYMVTEFIPVLKALIKDNDLTTNDAENPFPGALLVGFSGKIFEIESDYQVAEHVEDFWAIGNMAGQYVALGALAAFKRWLDYPSPGYREVSDPNFLLVEAMKIVSRYDSSAGEPYTIAVA